ncbi:MAG: twin-arginine translocation signal domain-containing protein [Gemmatimonadaceae bacterium]
MIDRRQFLRFLGAIAVGVASAGCKPGAEYDVQSLARPDILSTLGVAEVRNIGERYRALHRSEADTSAIRNAFLGSRPLAARLGFTNPPIATLVQDDFAHGRTVVLDGWILSVTEARQCALLASLAA